MATTKSPRSAVDVLIKKLGHELEEIRVRSLKNILSKLEHGLVTVEDIVGESLLFVKLLEWFNFPSPPMKMEVLMLISKLSKISDGAKTLFGVGGATFLEKLRDNADASLHSLISEIMENLSCIPFNSALTTEHCSYKARADDSNEFSVTRLPALSETAVENCIFGADKSTSNKLSSNSDQDLSSCGAPLVEPEFVLQPNEEASEILNITNYDETLPTCDNLVPEQKVSINCLIFPWLPLTSTDRYVLSSTNDSLQSGDVKLMINSCDFLNDVVLQDFPAEIFLQRPHIIKTLFGLLEQPQQNSKLMFKILECLNTFTSNLRTRLRLISDPAMYCFKSVYRNSGSISELGLASVEQRENPSSANEKLLSDSENESAETLFTIQSMQISLPEFCSTLFNKGSKLLQHNNYQIIAFLVTVMHHAIDLLEILLKTFKGEESVILQELLEMIYPFLTVAGNLITNCHKKVKNFMQNDYIVRCTRTISLCLLDMACKLLKMLITPCDICNAKLPGEFMQAMTTMVFDYSFMRCHPELHEFLLECAQYMNNNLFVKFFEAQSISEGMEAVGQFMNLNDSSNDFTELLRLAEKSTYCISYHENTEFVEAFIEVYGRICSNSDISEKYSETARDIFLELILNDCKTVRFATYRQIEQHVKKNLKNTRELNFVIDPVILSIFVCIGLSDADFQISKVARNIVYSLLKTTEKNSNEYKQNLIKRLQPSLSVLQGYAGLDTLFGQCISSIVDPETECLSVLETVKGNFRILFSKHKRLRERAFNNLVCIWSKFGNDDAECFESYKHDVSLVLICDSKSDLANIRIPRNSQVSHLIGALEMLNDSELDSDLRCSSCQRLAYLLDDVFLHEEFLNRKGIDILLKGTEAVLTDLHEHPTSKEFANTLFACFRSFLKIIIHNSEERSHLAGNLKFYSLIFKGILHVQEEIQAKHGLAQIVALLVFKDCIRNRKPSSGEDGTAMISTVSISVLSMISDRFLLPFDALTHSAKDHLLIQNRSFVSSAMHLDSSGMDMVRLAWNCSWYGGLDELARIDRPEPNEIFPKKIQLTLLDHLIVKITHPKTTYIYALKEITNACSHREVRHLLTVLQLQLTMSKEPDALSDLGAIWHETFGRFLCVLPHSKADESLLYDILTFMLLAINQPRFVRVEVRDWIISDILNAEHAVVNLIVDHLTLSEKDLQKMSSKPLNLQLIKVVTLAATISLTSTTTSANALKDIRGELVVALLKNLTFGDTHHVYNLALLERTLQCFVHITGRCGWSNNLERARRDTFYKQMFSALVDILFAFSAGRGGADNSFMGKGVTKAATLTMRHLFAEMKSQTGTITAIDGMGSNQAGLMWLIPLWSYSDPDVCASSLGIAAILASTKLGCLMLNQYTKQLPGGVWGSCLSILLNDMETSFVKEQATYLLINLFSWPLPKSSDDGENIWNSFAFCDLRTQASLFGLEALAAILQQNHFCKEINRILTYYSCLPFVPLLLLHHSAHNGAFQHIMVTPSLVSVIATLLGILTELLPDVIYVQQLGEALLKILDGIQLVEFALARANCGSTDELVEMHASVLNLVVAWTLKDDIFKDKVTKNPVILRKILPLLDCRLQEKSSLTPKVWVAALKLLNVILGNFERLGQFFVLSLVKLHWITLAGNLEVTLSDSSSPENLLSITLRSLAVISIMNANIKPSQETSPVNILDSPNEGDSWGSTFAKLLLKAYERNLTLPSASANALRILISETFGALLFVSQTSKEIALKRGLLKLIVDQLQNIHVHYTMNSFASPAILRKKASFVYDDLLAHLVLLNNLMFNSNEAKVAATKCGIGEALKIMWVWIIQDSKLTTAMLKLLCTFTACSSINSKPALEKDQQMGPKCPLKSNLIHSVIQLSCSQIGRFGTKPDNLHGKLSFEVLTNLCSYTDSRSLLCKSTFLEEFANLDIRSTTTKASQELVNLWLLFLSHLSFYQDGQEAIFRLSSGIDLLLEILETCAPFDNKQTLLVLRNLSFHSTFRSRLCNSEKCIPLLVNQISEANPDLKPIAASALWALCTNNQKTKSLIRNESILKRLSEFKSQCQNAETNLEENKLTSQTLETIIKICS